MSFIYDYVVSYFYPPAPPKPAPSERDAWVSQFDKQTVDFVVGDVDLAAIPIKDNLALFQKVHWLSVQAAAMRDRFNIDIFSSLRDRAIVNKTFDEFRNDVVQVERAAIAAIPKTPAPDPVPQRRLSVVTVLPPPASAPIAADEDDAPAVRQLSSVSAASAASSEDTGDAQSPAPEVARRLSHFMSEEPLPPASPPEEPLVGIPATGREEDDRAFAERVQKFKASFESARLAPATVDRLLQLDGVRSPSHLQMGADLDLNNFHHLAPLVTGVDREMVVASIDQKLVEIGCYRQYLAEVQTALASQPENLDLQGQQAGLIAKIDRLKRQCIELMTKVERAAPLQAPVKQPPQPQEDAHYYVVPLGNVLFKEVATGGVEFEPSGKWAVVDLSGITDSESRKAIIPFLTKQFFQRMLHNQEANVPVCLRRAGDALILDPKGKIRIFWERPVDVFNSHENRAAGERVRILQDKESGRYKRVIIDAKGCEKGTDTKVTMHGKKDHRTAEIDRLQAIWMPRLVAQEILKGNAKPIDFNFLQRTFAYFSGILQSDLAGRYLQDRQLIEAAHFLKKIEQSSVGLAEDRILFKILQKDDRHRQTNLADSMKAVGEVVETYRKWLNSIDRFLELVKEYPEFEREFRWFIQQLEGYETSASRIPGARDHIHTFAGRFPMDLTADNDQQRIELIQKILDAFYGKINDVSPLMFNHFDALKLALSRLQSAVGNPQVERRRKDLLNGFLRKEGLAFLKNPSQRIAQAYRRLNQNRDPDPAQLEAWSRWIKEESKDWAGNDRISISGSLQYLSTVVPEALQANPELLAAATVALRSLDDLSKAENEAFPNMFQVPKRTHDCIEAVYKNNRALTMLHFKTMEILTMAARVVSRIEWLRLREGKKVLKADELAEYFPSRS